MKTIEKWVHVHWCTRLWFFTKTESKYNIQAMPIPKTLHHLDSATREGGLQNDMMETFSISGCNKNWSNILVLVELLFCIPGRVEWVYSHLNLKVIKSYRWSTLGNERLSNLVRIKVDSSPLAAVDLWWTRRVNHRDTRAAPSQMSTDKGPDSGSSCSYTFVWKTRKPGLNLSQET